MTHNCLYYWTGGTVLGQWRLAMPITGGPTLADMATSIERQGYVVRYGHTRIGPPEGPPR